MIFIEVLSNLSNIGYITKLKEEKNMVETKDQYFDYISKRTKKNGSKLGQKTILIYYKEYKILVNKYGDLSKIDKDKLVEMFNKEVRMRRIKRLKSIYKDIMKFLGYKKKDIQDIDEEIYSRSVINNEAYLREKVIKKDNIKKIFNDLYEVKDLFLLVFMRMLYETACRISEIIQIKYEDIEDSNIVHVLGKGNKKRDVLISQKTKSLLKIYKKNNNIKDNKKLFEFRKSNGELTKDQEHSAREVIYKCTKKYLGEKINPHSFRHTKASHLADEGIDVVHIKTYLGHADIGTSMIYIKSSMTASINIVNDKTEVL